MIYRNKVQTFCGVKKNNFAASGNQKPQYEQSSINQPNLKRLSRDHLAKITPGEQQLIGEVTKALEQIKTCT